MKKNHLLSGLVLIMMLAMVPMNFYGQTEAAPKTEKSSAAFDRHLYFIGDAGLSLFNGDLNQYGFAADPRYYKLKGNLGLGYQFTPVFGTFGRIGMGKLGGEKDWRNVKLAENDFIDGNLNLSFNLMNLFWGYNPNRKFTFAPHIGIGNTNYRAKAIDLTTGAPISEVGYTANDPEKGWLGNRASALTVPIGTDLNFHITEKVDVYANYTFNFMNKDNMDAFTDTDLGQRREGSVLNDMYSHLNVGLRFKLITSSVKSMADNFGLVELQTIPDPLVEQGDSVVVTIKGKFPPKYFKKNAAMNFTPVLTWDGGSVALKPINFKGESVSGDGIPVNYAQGGTFTYTDKIPYNPQMNVSELVVSPLIYATKTITNTTRESVMANEKFFTADQRKLADGVVYTSKRIADSFRTSVAPHGYEKVTIVPQNAIIYYKVNLHNLDMNLPLNRKQETRDMLKAVTKNIEMGWELKDITIAGWASPEGEETFNNGLSERRSATARKYMEGELQKLIRNRNIKTSFAKLADVKFETSANGPDWNGFMSAVEASNIKDKNAILNVIRSAPVAQREQEIRNMILIYPELENEILPPLRRANITVNSFEPKKTDDEIARLSTSDPSKLQLNELLYAATLTDDFRTRKMIYASAMELHPKCTRAIINAAEVEIQLGNMAQAKSLLEKVVGMTDKSALAFNNLAVVAISERNFKAAENYINKAKQLGADENYNSGIVQIFKGNYPQAISLMKAEKCEYNLGLAQLLNADYAAARATLECAPANAKAHYLKAIIGARTNESAYLYSNLIKAIEMDGSYKNTAKWDREFIKFFGQPDFQAIVK